MNSRPHYQTCAARQQNDIGNCRNLNSQRLVAVCRSLLMLCGLVGLTGLSLHVVEGRGAALAADLSGEIPTANTNALLAPANTAHTRIRVMDLAASRGVSQEVQAQLNAQWPAEQAVPAEQLLLLVARSLALINPQGESLLALCQQTVPPVSLPPLDWLDDPTLDPWAEVQLRMLLARTLTDWRLYDEALVQLEQAPPEQVVDPASRLFCEAVAAQAMLDLGRTQLSLQRLLEQTEQVPQRYVALATLMLSDLEQTDGKDLHRIARRMTDSERRLDLGRAGQQIQDVQDRIVADLDELIKKIEAQQGGGGGGGSGQGNSNQSNGPAQDSSVKGATAPGTTDPKRFSKSGSWGNLPEKQQAQARNLINRNFPPHYGKAIEKYFEKLANRTVETPAAESAP